MGIKSRKGLLNLIFNEENQIESRPPVSLGNIWDCMKYEMFDSCENKWGNMITYLIIFW